MWFFKEKERSSELALTPPGRRAATAWMPPAAACAATVFSVPLWTLRRDLEHCCRATGVPPSPLERPGFQF
ncbi:hypothetical protein E2562_011908 [Oryza meyeriana var. granulata]|uniref:Uncharacterized protein n=1 Tax=Oryza meyeriana var. granulata TaxID=110450 RepID=A0A6G1CGV9_9ORYZ|nr:hypothetical protein E2562_011908 [Oryza meyeriana var. granulata]